MSELSSSRPAASDLCPVPLSAKALHELALEAFRVGNRGKLSLCEALRVLSETRLYLELGCPSLAAYADTFFQLRRADAFEYVRVARRLVELTELREAFGQGRLGWSVLKAITRVASVDSQASWIEFARKQGVERTIAEARDARRRGRVAPRKSSFGLPNLDQKLVLRFSRSDMNKVRTWIENACALIAESTGADDVSLEQAILFLCEKQMGSGAGGSPRAQVVYQRCPDCTNARMGTRDGFVEVSTEEVERYEGCAEKTVIDGPTPPRLRRQVLAREAGRCANPRCQHRADHCHHITFRSRGGKTVLENEAAVCRTCHALIHAGLLRVVGRADGELQWVPIGANDTLSREVAAERAVADRLPVVQFVEGPAGEESAAADFNTISSTGSENALDLDALASGLMRLGVTATRSRQIIGTAAHALPNHQATEEAVLKRALALL